VMQAAQCAVGKDSAMRAFLGKARSAKSSAAGAAEQAGHAETEGVSVAAVISVKFVQDNPLFKGGSIRCQRDHADVPVSVDQVYRGHIGAAIKGEVRA